MMQARSSSRRAPGSKHPKRCSISSTEASCSMFCGSCWEQRGRNCPRPRARRHTRFLLTRAGRNGRRGLDPVIPRQRPGVVHGKHARLGGRRGEQSQAKSRRHQPRCARSRERRGGTFLLRRNLRLRAARKPQDETGRMTMAFIDMGDQFLALSEGRRQGPTIRGISVWLSTTGRNCAPSPNARGRGWSTARLTS